MAKQYFVMGIGGTGMRCIESLIHLCGMGMFDNTDIHLLALDTDKNNGNFARLKQVKEAYLKAKGTDNTTHEELNNTFFSANIYYYEFSPDYEDKSNFETVFKYGDAKSRHPEQAAIADLLFTDNVKSFNLRHGYRAQTHLGSMLMYYSILETALSKKRNDLHAFITQIVQHSDAKIFILGSVFGGTGASSIPIIPQAISEAAKIISRDGTDLLQNAYFGATLLTAYFTFDEPNPDELKKQKIIATSDKFALNSQVAMMFYEKDATVKSTYQKFYMLGMPRAEDWQSINKKGINTGGANQCNNSHYIELLAACAALDFFNSEEEDLRLRKQNPDTKSKYLFRAINTDEQLEFRDFVDDKKNGKKLSKEFAKKFGLFTVFSILCNGKADFVKRIKTGRYKNIVDFRDIDDTQIEGIKQYFKLFHFYIQPDNLLYKGWLPQLCHSTKGSNHFMLKSELFRITKSKEMDNYKWDKELYKDDYKFNVGVFGSKFDKFMTEFIKQKRKELPDMNKGEQLYKYIYNTLDSLYKF